MGQIYTKQEKEKNDEKTVNAMEYVNRMFNQQTRQQKEAEKPRVESTK